MALDRREAALQGRVERGLVLLAHPQHLAELELPAPKHLRQDGSGHHHVSTLTIQAA